MSFEVLMNTSLRLAESAEALAALGAELRLRRDGRAMPQIRALLQDTVRAIDPRLLDEIGAGHEQAVLGVIQTIFRQALDLLDNPTRPPGWIYEDAVILQSQGDASRLIVRGIEALASQRPELKEALSRPGAFLDIGTGVGRLAIETASSFPALMVVGVDIWEPALELAHRNLANSPVAKRVELRLQAVEELEDEARFTVAWFPGPFIGPDVAARALVRVLRALLPGGWLVFGLQAQASTLLGEALAKLRIVRSGGHPWTRIEVNKQLSAVGFDRLEEFSPTPAILFVVGRRVGEFGLSST
jgi:SAM-dependent methyltransferase